MVGTVCSTRIEITGTTSCLSTHPGSFGRRELQPSGCGVIQISGMPPASHQSSARVCRSAEQKMSYFMCNDVTKQYRFRTGSCRIECRQYAVAKDRCIRCVFSSGYSKTQRVLIHKAARRSRHDPKDEKT